MSLDPITAISDLASTVLNRVLPDKSAQAAAQTALAQMKESGELAQIAAQTTVDNTEAASSSIFVAGWRPFVGWVCGSGMAYQFIVRPLLTFGSHFIGHPVDAPGLDMGTLMELLAGMLGLAGMRTAEKIQGVACNTDGTGH